MKRKHPFLMAFIALMLCVLGCSDRKVSPGLTNAAVCVGMNGDVATTDRWLGQCNGPEGAFLRLAGGQGTYDITIQNLGGPRDFKGITVGRQIEFERDGRKESIQATGGAGTGMKWLVGKSNCLRVRLGEGYCRD